MFFVKPVALQISLQASRLSCQHKTLLNTDRQHNTETLLQGDQNFIDAHLGNKRWQGNLDFSSGRGSRLLQGSGFFQPMESLTPVHRGCKTFLQVRMKNSDLIIFCTPFAQV